MESAEFIARLKRTILILGKNRCSYFLQELLLYSAEQKLKSTQHIHKKVSESMVSKEKMHLSENSHFEIRTLLFCEYLTVYLYNK